MEEEPHNVIEEEPIITAPTSPTKHTPTSMIRTLCFIVQKAPYAFTSRVNDDCCSQYFYFTFHSVGLPKRVHGIAP